MSQNSGGEWLLLVIWIAGMVGWGLNLAEIAHSATIDGMVVLRVIGVFIAPLGAVLGFL